MKIGVIGLGYVGLVAAAGFSDMGHEVFCTDSNLGKIHTLKKGQTPFFEPGLGDLLLKNRSRITFFESIREVVESSSVIFIAVGTPELPSGQADLTDTFKVLAEICEVAVESKWIVLKSTVPIGAWKETQIFCDKQGRVKLEIINNPEFLKQGSAIEDFLHPDRIVIGCQTEGAKEIMEKVYRPFMDKGQSVIFMDNTSAEMTKYAANSFLAMKISFINELANLAEKLEADIDKVREGFTSDSRINPSFFQVGIGYGGSCFPKDIRALISTAEDVDVEMKLLKATDLVNENQKSLISRKISNRFRVLNDKVIALWGLSFKPNTDDVRRAPSVQLIEELVSLGARVQAYDPVAGENAKEASDKDFVLTKTAFEAVKGADALVIVTEWPEFKAVDFSAVKAEMRSPVIFDGRNMLEPKVMANCGFEYFGVGRGLKNF